jgi:hypothetical protein
MELQCCGFRQLQCDCPFAFESADVNRQGCFSTGNSMKESTSSLRTLRMPPGRRNGQFVVSRGTPILFHNVSPNLTVELQILVEH